MSPVWETASRSEPIFWVVVSARGPTGKRILEFSQIAGRTFQQDVTKGPPLYRTRLAMLRNRFFESGMKILDSYL